MYRVLLLSEANSAPGDFAQFYFRRYAGDRAEVFAAGIELGKRDKIVAELLGDELSGMVDEEMHTVSDFQSLEFDFIITLDEPAEKESHHFSSHIIKYHYNYSELLPAGTSREEKYTAYTKLRDRIKKDMRSFVKEHIPD